MIPVLTRGKRECKPRQSQLINVTSNRLANSINISFIDFATVHLCKKSITIHKCPVCQTKISGFDSSQVQLQMLFECDIIRYI